MAAIKRTHDQIVDSLVARLQDKHDFVRKENRYFTGERCVGEMDVTTIDWYGGKAHIHYYEVKTGDYRHARHRARQQYHTFMDAYRWRKDVVPTFIFYHPERGFERWKR
jgi:hypothetical protein